MLVVSRLQQVAVLYQQDLLFMSVSHSALPVTAL